MLPVTALNSVAAAITASLNVGCSASKFSLVPELDPNFNILDKGYAHYPITTIVDIRKKLPFDSNSIDQIYCSQVVEHLFKFELN
jgi:predicted SAM-dependent methyltransferase